MYTQCPHCHAIYRIDAGTLAAARGQVQCGDCELNFDALSSLKDELPDAESRWENTEFPFAAHLSEDATPEPPAAAEVEDDYGPPDEAEPPTGADWPGQVGSRRVWLAGSLALALAAVAQVVFFAPGALANHERLRPAARALCEFSGCVVAPRRDLSQLRLASRDVRAHPSVPGALIISATLVNDAPFEQPYPVLEISLGDLRGDQVALRRFKPEVYLPDSVDVASGMAPESRTQVSLEVVDPGESAVAFQFAFRTAGIDERRF